MKKIKSMWNFVKNKFYKNGITAIAKKDWWQIVFVVCFFVYSIYFYANNLLNSDLSDDLYFSVQNFLIFSNILISGLYFCKKQTKKLIWGVQIQTIKTTFFSLTFTLFLTLFSTIFYNLFEHNEVLKCENLSLIVENLRNFDQCTKDYAEGATQIMIAIGTSLMAIAIFVFESIAKKRRYFDKYFLLSITNIFNLVILFFIGLFLLIFHYFDTPFISHFVKNFIDIYIYCLILIALAVIRIYKTAMCLLYKLKSDNIEDDIISNLYLNHKLELNKNQELKTNKKVDSLFHFTLKDMIKRLNNNEEENIIEYENTLRVITVFLKYHFKDLEKKDPYSFNVIEILKFISPRFDNEYYIDLINVIFENNFEIKDGEFAYYLAVDYLNIIEKYKNTSEISKLIGAPSKIFKILINKKIIINKLEYHFNNPIQNYFYYFISLYEKGFEIKNSDKKLSKNEENFANILIDKSWQLPQELIKYHLVPNYERDQQYQAISGEEGNKNSLFFKNYAKEFFIFYRELLKICFDNDDFESFEIISRSLRKLLKCDYNHIEKNDENYREIQQYKLLNLYGLASWILEKTNIDRAEKNQRFIDNICNHIFDIIDRENEIDLHETKFSKFIKLYIKAKKLDDNFDTDYLLGLDRWDRASRGKGAWMSEVSPWINNFFIYFCLAKFDKDRMPKNLTVELSNIFKSSNQAYIFNEIINNLDDLLEINKTSNNNNILKLLNKPIKDADNLINDLKNAINSIIGFIAKERVKDVMESKIDKNKIAKFKDEIKQLYQKSFSIKNILKQFGLYDLKAFNQHDNEFGINEALDKEYFIENSNIHLIGFDESCSNSIIAEENDNILNKAILQNPRLAEKLVLTNLNEFEKILESFGKDVILSEDVILILLNTGEHWFESELNKRTYYKNNFIAPRLRNTSESIPENAVGIYKFNQQKIPVYSIYSETKSGLLVLNKKKFGKLIQYKMNENAKSIFEKEFYLEILDNEDGQNKDFKELQDNPPNWLKSKGDSDAQENYLKQIVILKFLQSFEFEPAENFEAYLIEMNPYF